MMQLSKLWLQSYQLPLPGFSVFQMSMNESVVIWMVYLKIQAIIKVMAGRMLYIAAANVAVVYFIPT